MTNPLTPRRDAPDYQAAYLRLVDKIYRTGLYYDLCSANYQTRANSCRDPQAAAVADAVSKSLHRASDDMTFIFNKACAILPPEEKERIIADNPVRFQPAA